MTDSAPQVEQSTRQLTLTELQERRDFIELDTIMNRRVIESARSFLFGAFVGSITGLGVSGAKRRLRTGALAGGISCLLFNNLKFSPWYWWSFEQWKDRNEAERANLSEEESALIGHRAPYHFPSGPFNNMQEVIQKEDGRV